MTLAFRCALIGVLLALWSPQAAADIVCGTVVTVETRDANTQSYSFAPATADDAVAVYVLLAGGHGHIRLDDGGCARNLKGNALIRNRDLLRAAGFAIAMVDAPSNLAGGDGIGGYRIDPDHAADLGLIIAGIRERTGLPIVLAGHSRGSISAANAAARLKGPRRPDALALLSTVSQGRPGSYKPWVAHSVFDLPLNRIDMPVLVVAHAADGCPRTPPDRAERVAAALSSGDVRLEMFSGGPMAAQPPTGLKACAGRAPHGYFEQGEELVSLLAEFARVAVAATR